MTPLDVMWVGPGAGLGSLLRCGRVVGERYRGDFPVGTFVINVSGAFAIGGLAVVNIVWCWATSQSPSD